MHADMLIVDISQLVTPAGHGAARGAAMGSLDIIDDAAMAVTGDRIVWVGPRSAWTGTATEVIETGNRAVVPALVDPHTHAVWAGDRLADFDARARGASYQEILAAGGGIRSTIAATSSSGSQSALVELARARVEQLTRSGAATIEVKSGYGFTRDAELMLLEVIAELARTSAATIMATLLIHVPPRERAEQTDYIAMVTEELIPEVSRRGLADAVDIFIEREAFSVAQAREVFAAAGDASLRIKAHVDQFHAIGGLELAVECNALSVDHLESSGAAQIAALAASDTIGVILPGVTLHLGIAAAPGRALIDAGAAVAVGTDLNPGSSPLFSTQMAMALSVRINGLTVGEALTASTANAAAALGLHDRGRLHAGQRANFIVVDSRDWRDMVYTLGGSPVGHLYARGREVTF